MQIPKARSTNVGFVSLLVVTSMLLVTATPGLAQPTQGDIYGEGGGHGWEFPGAVTEGVCPAPPIPPPVRMESDYFDLHHYGTYEGVAGTPAETVALYAGTTYVEIIVGTHYFGPLGVYAECPGPDGIPTAVPITAATVSGTTAFDPSGGGEGFVRCSYTTGTYSRVQSAVTFHLEGGFTSYPQPGACEVKGNVQGAREHVADATDHEIAGTMTPCRPPIPPTFEPGPVTPECAAAWSVDPSHTRPNDTPPGSHLVTTYVAHPDTDGP